MTTERRELEGQTEPEVRQPLLKHLGMLVKGNDTQLDRQCHRSGSALIEPILKAGSE